MKTGEIVVLWILATAWLCIEAFFLATPAIDVTPEQWDAAYELAEQLVEVLGFDAIRWIAAAGVLWVAKGVIGLVILLLVGVEFVRWFRRHPPVAIPEEASA